MKGLQKVVRWFLDADDNPDSHQNLSITFWHIYNVPWNLHANLFHGICEVNKLTSRKYAKTFNFLCAGNKDFVKYQGQRGWLNPIPPMCMPLCECMANVTVIVIECSLSDHSFCSTLITACISPCSKLATIFICGFITDSASQNIFPFMSRCAIFISGVSKEERWFLLHVSGVIYDWWMEGILLFA